MKLGSRLIASVTMFLAASGVGADTIIVQSTTSTANSGFYDHILPLFKMETGISANVVAVGTGQAIRNAENCDGDVLLVHAKAAEEAYVERGGGVSRANLMYNDFVLVGPEKDPASVLGMNSVDQAMIAIAETQSLFASRGDDSGTHKKELSLWAQTGIDPKPESGTWYRETGSGMGSTLNAGIGMAAYVLTDRATWVTFGNKQDFKIVLEGDPALFNQYGIILVNRAVCPNVNSSAGKTFIDWMTSETGQGHIGAFMVEGQRLFVPNAASPE